MSAHRNAAHPLPEMSDESSSVRPNGRATTTPGPANDPVPEHLLSVKDAAGLVGCCEETIRRAYLARQLDVQRFGARSVRVRPSALKVWLDRGGKTTAA